MIKKTCNFCSGVFLVYPYRQKIAHFCNRNCYHNYQKKLAYQSKICPHCGKTFFPNRRTRGNKYCSNECGILGRRKYKIGNERIKWLNKEKTKIYKWRGEKICVYCKRKFKFTSKNIHQRYCGVICQIRSRAYNIDENFFNKIDTEGKAYLLGFIFADGNISSKKNYINIPSKDKGLIVLFKKLLSTNRPIYHYQNLFSLTIGNQNLHQSLKKLGILQRKSWKNYGLPKISRYLMWHFLRGVFDGDGSFYIDDKDKWKYLCASFSCGSLRFLKEIRKWLETTTKIKMSEIRFDRKLDNTGCWQLRITRKDAVKEFTDYLYKNSNYFLTRKYKLVKNFYGR